MKNLPKLPEVPSFDLTGKKALVVGASSGIGLSSACALAAHGAIVTIAARRTNELKNIFEQMKEKGWETKYLEMDIAKVEETISLVNKNGPFDILVNSAGLARHSPMIETTVEDFDQVMAVNVRGAYFFIASGRKWHVKFWKSRFNNQHLKSDGSCWWPGASCVLCFKICCRRVYKIDGD